MHTIRSIAAYNGRRSAIEAAGIVVLLILGFALRVHALDRVPPGWRDDEVIETTVHAQRVLDGEWPIFFVEANGHEPLYHYASAAAIALWGAGLFQVRLVSAFFGLLSLAANYRLARRWFGPRVALISTFLLAASFWALMYSRTKIRHISALPFALLAFDEFLRLARDGWRTARPALPPPLSPLHITPSTLTASVFLALALYTYFAARAAPVVLAAFVVYLAAVHRAAFTAAWRKLALAFLIAAVLALPLVWAIRSQPNAEARLSEIGLPLTALLKGNPLPAVQGAIATLGMFGWAGDPEALYNVPGRPVLNWFGAIPFALGVVVSLRRWRDPRFAFVTLWLFIGLAPAFVSIPAASLGHTILAQPAVYLAMGIGLETVISNQSSATRGRNHPQVTGRWSLITGRWLLVAVALIIVAARDLRDYFLIWPREPLVRHLYRADLREAALVSRQLPLSNYAVSSRLSLWDSRAFALDAPQIHARWFNPETALLYPAQSDAPIITFSDPPVSDWARERIEADYTPIASPGPLTLWGAIGNHQPTTTAPPVVRWANGIELVESRIVGHPARGGTAEVEITWRVSQGYLTPAPPIGASPDPPPQPFTSFVHVLSANRKLIAGYDRFDADAFSLRPGDVIIQRYQPALPVDAPPGQYMLEVGWYDPVSGKRFPTVAGEGSFTFGAIELQE